MNDHRSTSGSLKVWPKFWWWIHQQQENDQSNAHIYPIFSVLFAWDQHIYLDQKFLGPLTLYSVFTNQHCWWPFPGYSSSVSESKDTNRGLSRLYSTKKSLIESLSYTSSEVKIRFGYCAIPCFGGLCEERLPCYCEDQ